jgi:hypothetical protein
MGLPPHFRIQRSWLTLAFVQIFFKRECLFLIRFLIKAFPKPPLPLALEDDSKFFQKRTCIDINFFFLLVHFKIFFKEVLSNIFKRMELAPPQILLAGCPKCDKQKQEQQPSDPHETPLQVEDMFPKQTLACEGENCTEKALLSLLKTEATAPVLVQNA